jgi:hypothetical protein
MVFLFSVQNELVMKFFLGLIFTVLLLAESIAQTNQGLLSQEESKLITEYKCKDFIINKVIAVPDKKSTEVYIDAITSSKSGELTTVIYFCESLDKIRSQNLSLINVRLFNSQVRNVNCNV